MTAVNGKTVSHDVFVQFWTQKSHHSSGNEIFHGGKFKINVVVTRSEGLQEKPQMTGRLLLLTLSVLSGLLRCYGFRICAFNIKSFGDSKSADAKIMNSVSRIVSRCDICLLQEVRDQKNKAIPRLLAAVNSLNGNDYDYVASERLGRTQNYQEQYVFVFRKSTVKLKNQYQYPDTQKGDVDAFSREPFVVHFQAPKTVAKEFVLIPQHTTPSNATKEIDELYDVFVDIRARWKIENVMFLGDFNAACGYVAKKNRKKIRLFTDPSFIWLIQDDVDTTVKQSTNCAYDRIVVHREPFLRTIEPISAQPFNFPKEFHLTEAEALEVSDHYPIEVLLKTQKVSFKGNNKALCLLPTVFVLNILLLLQMII